MNKISGFGFMTIAIGAPRYLRQAEVLSLSLRRNMPGIPIAIVTDSDTLKPYADLLVPYDKSYPVATAQKLLLDQYSPFDETMFIDSDCIATRDFHEELSEIRRYPFTPVMGALTPPNGRDEYVKDLRAALEKVGGSAFPKFNGGVYSFHRSDVASEIFGKARDYFKNYHDYGLKPFDRGGPGDETVIALALAATATLDLYKDRGRLMRTPTGLKGRIAIDPMGGGCSFERAEGVVTPAICHFAGEFLLSPEYRLAEAALRTGTAMKDLSAAEHVKARCGSAWAHASRFAEYRVNGIKRRLKGLR
jgi:hypothetical protein